MIVIPAIDLQKGQCVRLAQGKKDKVTIYSDDPVSIAIKWVEQGAKLLHIVDLDGAFSGMQQNIETVRSIRKAVHIPIQLGGGIRDIEGIRKLTSMGIDRIIIGTSAFSNPSLIKEACEKFKGQIFVGIDATEGRVAVRGWVEITEREAFAFAKEMESYGIEGIIYTDISRDGMLTGPNIEAMSKMVDAVSVPVIASGGVSGIEDIKELMLIERLWGVITGKALYTGELNLKQALEITRGD